MTPKLTLKARDSLEGMTLLSTWGKTQADPMSQSGNTREENTQQISRRTRSSHRNSQRISRRRDRLATEGTLPSFEAISVEIQDGAKREEAQDDAEMSSKYHSFKHVKNCLLMNYSYVT